MHDEHLQRLEDLFQRAADLPAAARPAFLDAACAGDAGLRARLEAMLADLERAESLGPARAGGGEGGPAEGPGTVIGRYRLLQVIGEGGFGVVYMAEQTEPVVRRVALKVVKLGMDTREVVARFEAERQALALMDHPNIARVLDAGATASGRPYFVMELVRGVSITEYCDRGDLRTRERLELFADVCHAVQHAHQKGVIHRDLKPSNVMVTLHDGRPVPKVIDFGIAKAMHARLTDKTLFTAYERFIGTPAYMSPEQAEMSGLDVDTRTDVYSLGVLLYELLTGTTPFDSSALLRAGLAEVKRVIREEEPPRPSVRISTSGDAGVARRRRVAVPELSRLVRGDLDWIVMRCLEKDRVRRYATASELAADVRRHLDDDPVLAGPPSRAYRLRKFLARNRAATASVSLVLLVLVGGVIGTGLGMLEASAQRDDALEARERWARAAADGEAVTDFLVRTIALTDPDVALQPELSVRTLLDRAALQIEEALSGQPDAEARVRATIGRAYLTLGELRAAELHLRRAVALVDAGAAMHPAEHYALLWALTHTLFRLEAPDALAVAQEARRVAHAHVRATEPALADALDAFIAAVNGVAFGPAPPDAIPALFTATVRESDAALPEGDPLWPIVADTWMAASFSFWFGEHEALSRPFLERALEIHLRELPESHPQVGETVSQLVGVLDRSGDAADAAERARAAVERLRRVYRPGNFQLAYCESMLGDSLAARGRFEEAERLLVDAHRVIRETIQDPTVFYVVDSCARVVTLYERWGREDAARPYRDELADVCARAKLFVPYHHARLAFGPGHGGLLALLDRMHELCGPFVVSASQAREVGPELEPVGAALADELRSLLAADARLAVVAARLTLWWTKAIASGLTDATRRRLVEGAAVVLAPRADELPYDVADAHAQLAELALAAGDERGARREALRAWSRLERLGTDDNWITAHAKVRVGRCFLRLGLHDEAERVLLPCHDVLAGQIGAENADVQAVRELIRELYVARGRPAGEAEALWSEPEGGGGGG